VSAGLAHTWMFDGRQDPGAAKVVFSVEGLAGDVAVRLTSFFACPVGRDTPSQSDSAAVISQSGILTNVIPSIRSSFMRCSKSNGVPDLV